MNRTSLLIGFLSLAAGQTTTFYTHERCWFSPTSSFNHCFDGEVTISWLMEPPRTVVEKVPVEVLLKVEVNTSAIPLAGCAPVHYADEHPEDVHHPTDFKNIDIAEKTGIFLAPFGANCLSQYGLCSPFNAVLEHSLDLCQPAGHECVISEPVTIGHLFPLFIHQSSALTVSPLRNATRHNFGTGLDFYFPDGWDTLEEQDQHRLLSVANLIPVSCDDVLCSEKGTQTAFDHYEQVQESHELMKYPGSDIAFSEFSVWFTLFEPDTSHTLLPFFELTTCGGYHGNVTFFASLEHFGTVVLSEPVTLTISSTVTTVVLVMKTVSGVLLLALLGVVVYNRKHQVIHDAQGEMLIFILIAGMLALLSTSTFDPTQLGCTAKEWSFDPIEPLMLCLLCARVWRIDALHQSARLCRRRIIPLRHVISVAFLLWLPIIVTCLFRTWLHPSKLELKLLPGGQKQAWVCHSTHAFVYKVVILGYDGFLLVLSAFAAFRSNSLTHKYNEGKIIAFAIQSCAMVFLMTTLAILLSDGNNPSAIFFLSALAIVLTVVVLSCSLILPKLRYLTETAISPEHEKSSAYLVGGEVVPTAKEILSILNPLSNRETIEPNQLKLLDESMQHLSKLIIGHDKMLKKRSVKGKVLFGLQSKRFSHQFTQETILI